MRYLGHILFRWHAIEPVQYQTWLEVYLISHQFEDLDNLTMRAVVRAPVKTRETRAQYPH